MSGRGLGQKAQVQAQAQKGPKRPTYRTSPTVPYLLYLIVIPKGRSRSILEMRQHWSVPNLMPTGSAIP